MESGTVYFYFLNLYRIRICIREIGIAPYDLGVVRCRSTEMSEYRDVEAFETEAGYGER